MFVDRKFNSTIDPKFYQLYDRKSFNIASFNTCAEFFTDNKLDLPQHHLSFREAPFENFFTQFSHNVWTFQELTPKSALMISNMLKKIGYDLWILSQTPSDIECGLMTNDTKLFQQWINSKIYIRTPFVGIAFKKNTFKLLNNCRFWLNDNPNKVPTDKTVEDKGYGNSRTYRATFGMQLLHIETNRKVFVFTSHYPLSGDSTSRLGCAKQQRKKMAKIAKECPYIWTGDFNLIELPEKSLSRDDVYSALTKDAVDVRDCENHYGHNTTWIGYCYDNFKNPIVDGKFKFPRTLDLIVSSGEIKPVKSYHLAPEFNQETKEIIQVTGKMQDAKNRNFISNHCVVGGQYIFYKHELPMHRKLYFIL